MKLKHLLPSLREKKRYIVYEVQANSQITHTEAKKEVSNKMKQFIGELGIAQAGLMHLKDWKNNQGIIKVNAKHVDHAKASLSLIKTINEKKATVKSVAVSGIINKLRKKYFTKEGN
tara:strand:- start:1522 stop:1872 length:351 start_codon:yes stop_codon:yes gene_type:complete